MPSSQDSVLAVIGSGPGIGSATASLFAQNGFNKVALISRNADRLKEDSQAVEQAAEKTQKHVSVRTWAVDITDTGAYGKVLDELASFGTLECVFFNAARVQPSYLMTEPIEQVEYDFKITNSALLTTARWAIPQLQSLLRSDSSSSPSFFVTNSFLYKEPIPQLFSLSSTKTAQRNLVQSLKMVYQKDGLHVALVSVGGQVSPQADNLTPSKIAEKIWELYKQTKKEWVWDLELLE